MKKIIIAITICIVGGFILAQYPKTPHIKPPIPADIDQALLTWAIINAATKEQKDCNLYIDRYQVSTTTGSGSFIYETIIPIIIINSAFTNLNKCSNYFKIFL